MTFYRFIKRNKDVAPRFWENVKYVDKHECKFPRITGKDLDEDYRIVMAHFRSNGANQRCLDVVNKYWEAYALKIDPKWKFPPKHPLRLPRDMAYWSGARPTAQLYPNFIRSSIKDSGLDVYFEEL